MERSAIRGSSDTEILDYAALHQGYALPISINTEFPRLDRGTQPLSNIMGPAVKPQGFGVF
jgi:hypothetical protein